MKFTEKDQRLFRTRLCMASLTALVVISFIPAPKSTLVSPHFQNIASAQILPETSTIDKETRQDIETYIKIIFGSESRTAIAVSRHECSPNNSAYPHCVLHSQVEYSVGLFQINLYNKDQWVHAGRIPGKTMEEKIEWLKDPYNNTLYAFWVFSKSGWNPWSAYTSGRYLADL